jgi:GTPase SAR1 family protein
MKRVFILSEMEGLFVEIKESMKAHVTLENDSRKKEILARLFEGESEISVDILSSGLSGASVFIVTPKGKSSFIVKIGSESEIKKEHENFEKIVEPYIQQRCAAIDGYAFSNELGGVKYKRVSGFWGQARNFKEYYETESSERVCQTLTNLLEGMLGENWYKRSYSKDCFLRELYNVILPAQFTIATEKISLPVEYNDKQDNFSDIGKFIVRETEGIIGEDISLDNLEIIEIDSSKFNIRVVEHQYSTKIDIKLSSKQNIKDLKTGDTISVKGGKIIDTRSNFLKKQIEIENSIFKLLVLEKSLDHNNIHFRQGTPLPNPIYYCQQILDKLVIARVSNIHGDLNLGNILVDEEHTPWLIDYGKTQENGHIAFDFAKLETEIKTHILSEKLTFEEFRDLEMQLLNTSLGNKALLLSNKEQNKAFEIIHTIREMAKHYLTRNPREYLYSLFAYSLAALKFQNLSDKKNAKLFAFTSAAISCICLMDLPLPTENIVTREFPYPIAKPYNDLLRLEESLRANQEKTFRELYNSLLDTFKFTVQFLTIVALSNYVKDDTFDEKTNQYMKQQFTGELSLKHWAEILCAVIQAYHDDRRKENFFVPELIEQREFLLEVARKLERFTETGDIESIILLESRFREYRVILDELLGKLMFLLSYEIIVPVEVKDGIVKLAYSCTGLNFREDDTQFSFMDDEIRKNNAVLLLMKEDRAKQLLLYPLSYFVVNDITTDLYLYERIIQIKEKVIEKLEFMGLRNRKSLPISISSNKWKGVLEDFIAGVGRLLIGGETTWEYLLKTSRQQTGRFIEELKKEYLPNLYCNRHSIEKEVGNFLESDKTGLIIIGDSGVGKSTLLCHLAENLLNKDENLVLFYSCGHSLTLDIETEIVKDLSIPSDVGLPLGFSEINEKADEQNKYIVIILDAINEFQDAQFRVGEMLTRIDGLIGRCNYSRIKFIVSCRTSTWNQLDLLGKTSRLFWHKYYTLDGENKPLILQRFCDDELRVAYKKYQVEYNIGTEFTNLSERTKEKFRDPFLLKITFDAYKNRDIIPNDILTMEVFKDYYEKKIEQKRDRRFLYDLIKLMRKRKVASLPLEIIENDEKLGKDATNDPDCAYQRLKDSGILQEYGQTIAPWIKFTYDRSFEYLLAQHFIIEEGISGSLSQKELEDLVKESREYPSLLGAVQFLLLLKHDTNLFSILAASDDYEVRGVVADSLYVMYEDAPNESLKMLNVLLENASDTAKKVAMKVAYNIGSEAKTVFLRGAANTSLKNPVIIDYLYLAWQRDPEFGFSILNELGKGIRLSRISTKRCRNELYSALGLTWRIFANFLYREDVIQELSGLWHDISVNKLPLIKMLTGNTTIARTVRNVITKVASEGVSSVIMEPALFSQFVEIETLFNSNNNNEKDMLTRITPFLDPYKKGLEERLDDLKAMLGSSLALPNVLAMSVFAIHTITRFDEMAPLIMDTFDRIDGWARLWLLFGFAIPSPLETPDSYPQLIDEMTTRFMSESRNDFLEDPWNMYRVFDPVLISSGLAHFNKGDKQLTFLVDLMSKAKKKKDILLLNRCIRGLGPTGLYFPKEVLGTLELIADFENKEEHDSIVKALAMIKTLYSDEVDRFLIRIGADDDLQNKIQKNVDADLVKRYVEWLGLYNAYVYSCLKYPLIRNELAISDNGFFLKIVNSTTSKEFLQSFTNTLIQFLQSHEFCLAACLQEKVDKLDSPSI